MKQEKLMRIGFLFVEQNDKLRKLNSSCRYCNIYGRKNIIFHKMLKCGVHKLGSIELFCR